MSKVFINGRQANVKEFTYNGKSIDYPLLCLEIACNDDFFRFFDGEHVHFYTEKIVTDPVVELWLKTFDDFEEVWLYDGSSVEMEEAYASELLGFRTAYNVFNEKLEKQKEQYEERILTLENKNISEETKREIKNIIGDERCFDPNCTCWCADCELLTSEEQYDIMKLLNIGAKLVCHKNEDED